MEGNLLSKGEFLQCRPAAILAADVVGYSRLMGKDETATLAALTTPAIGPVIMPAGSSRSQEVGPITIIAGRYSEFRNCLAEHTRK